MRFIQVDGSSLQSDILRIHNELKADINTIFVYTGSKTLYDYINDLHNRGKGVTNEELYTFKCCYEKTDLQISYKSNGTKLAISTMSGLINALDGKNCKIVVLNDNREHLAFIVQQLIYIGYPIESVDILLKKEEKDAAKTQCFMREINRLLQTCDSAYKKLTALKKIADAEAEDSTKAERIKDIEESIATCEEIQKQLKKASDVELKLAVAASKKAGKSVIVNCFIGEEIAPTSTELATPNNCIYKRSEGEKYTLQLEGENDQQFFDDSNAIYETIDGYFRDAQNNSNNAFKLPDMTIHYPTNANNFASYTIYDTAGPDAAGTKHADAAYEAMQKCDVAIFAIDYAKYLTDTEEKYLSEVKEMFTRHQKFHSLIFALNKVDVRYTDAKATKSIIMSVDFIRTRLANIDEAYRDCIIFPTCSLEYFYAIEAERKNVSELNDKISRRDLEDLADERRDVECLDWLYRHSRALYYNHGIKEFSYDVFKKDSGIPALMNHVSYVAQSKARDEIVNSVTHNIDTQKTRLRKIFDHIHNIEALIMADDEKITRIKKIIQEYHEASKRIFSSKITSFDMESFPNSGKKSLISEGKNLKEIPEDREKAIIDDIDAPALADVFYANLVGTIWTAINKYDKITGHEIDTLITDTDLRRIINQMIKGRISIATADALAVASKIKAELETIYKHRLDVFNKENDRCRELLSKEEVSITLPSLPAFSFATPLSQPNDVQLHLEHLNLSLYKKLNSIFTKKFNLWKWITGADAKDYNYRLNGDIDRKKFQETCDETIKGDIIAFFLVNGLATTCCHEVVKAAINRYLSPMLTEIKTAFDITTSVYLECVDRFAAAVDDREVYLKNIHALTNRKNTITKIHEATDAFMAVWEEIIHSVDAVDSDAETAAPELLPV